MYYFVKRCFTLSVIGRNKVPRFSLVNNDHGIMTIVPDVDHVIKCNHVSASHVSVVVPPLTVAFR